MSSARTMVERGRASSFWTPADWKSAFGDLVVVAVMLLADVAALLASLIGSLLIGGAVDMLVSDPPWHPVALFEIEQRVGQLLVIGAALLVYRLLHGQYRKRLSAISEARELIVASLFVMLVSLLAETMLHGALARHVLVAACVMFPFAALGTRTLARQLLWRLGLWREDVVLVVDEGAPDETNTAILSHHALGFRLVDVLTPAQVLGSNEAGDLRALLRLRRAGRFVVQVSEETEDSRRLLRAVARSHVPFSLLRRGEDLPMVGCERFALPSSGFELVSVRNRAAPLSRALKTTVDVAGAFVLLGALALPMLAIALLVKLDGGPALFAHQRLGANGRLFGCLKFRTMVTDGDAVLRAHLAADPEAAAEWAETRKLHRDPRVTRIGRILRATSLDELPQLLNVLAGDMSLVGPRPIVAQEVERYADDIAYYYGAKPGLTGLWQVSGRSDTTYETRVALDSWYVRNRATAADLGILARTVPAVLFRRGAR